MRCIAVRLRNVTVRKIIQPIAETGYPADNSASVEKPLFILLLLVAYLVYF